MVKHEIDTARYNNAASLIRTHGILAIVFGSLGTAFGLLLIPLMWAGEYGDVSTADLVGGFIFAIATFVFWVLPHVYLIVSGTYLLKMPQPKIAKTLIIINLVVSAFWNLVILVFAIINLTQFEDYNQGHKK